MRYHRPRALAARRQRLALVAVTKHGRRLHRSMVLSPDELSLRAHHEAGHAVAALSFGLRILLLTIAPDDKAWTGQLSHSPIADVLPTGIADADLSALHALRIVSICLAGPAAERRYAGDAYDPTPNTTDYARARYFSGHVTRSDEEADAFVRWIEIRMTRFVEHHWEQIAALAGRLAVEGALDHDLAASVVASHPAPSTDVSQLGAP